MRLPILLLSALAATLAAASSKKFNDVDVSVKFPESNPFAKVSNGVSTNTLLVRLTNHQTDDITVTRVYGRFYEAAGRERDLRNTTSITLKQPVLAGRGSPLIPYKFHSENAVGEVGLRVWVEYLDFRGKAHHVLGYEAAVTVVEPKGSWFDIQLLAAYAMLLAVISFGTYLVYSSYIVAPVSKKRTRAPRPAAPKEPVNIIVGKSTYEEEWVPEHVIRQLKQRKAKGEKAMSGTESEGGKKKAKK